METPVKEKPTVTDIIHNGVQGFLNKNKNISVKDLLTQQGRQNAGKQLKTTFKSSALDTAQNAINHLRKEDIAQFDKLVKTIRNTPDLSPKKKINCLKIAGKVRGMNTCEEVSRRKKPSALKKKAKLDAALEKLKKARASVKEDVARFDKLVKTIKNTPDLSKEKTARLLRIAGKVRGMGEDFEGVFRKDDPARKTPGKTITTKAKNVGYERGDLPAADDKKKGENREKGGPITQKQNPRVGEPDGPDDKRTKRGERKLKAIDKLTDKRKEKIKSGLKTGAKVANASAKVAGYVGSKAKSGISAFTSGYDAKEEKTFSQYTEGAALAIPLAKWGIPAAITAVGAIGTAYQMSNKKSPGQTNLFPKGSPENPFSNDKRSSSKRNQRISKKAQKSAEDKWRDDNNLGGTNVEPPWKGK